MQNPETPTVIKTTAQALEALAATVFTALVEDEQYESLERLAAALATELGYQLVEDA